MPNASAALYAAAVLLLAALLAHEWLATRTRRRTRPAQRPATLPRGTASRGEVEDARRRATAALAALDGRRGEAGGGGGMSAPDGWGFACPEREPDGFTLPPHVAESWRQGLHAYAAVLHREAERVEQIGQLRYVASRLDAFAARLRHSADVWEQGEREYMQTQHLERARYRRHTGVEIVRVSPPNDPSPPARRGRS